MTCRAATGFVHHALDFSQPPPPGFARCMACGDFVTREQWAAWPCTGAKRETSVARTTPTSVACAQCGAEIVTAPRHRAQAERVGMVCPACAAASAEGS